MELTLNVPDETVRKIRALNILLGGTEDLDTLLIGLVDQAVTSAITDKILGAAQRTVVAELLPARKAAPRETEFQDLTGVSDGLGDPEPARGTRRRGTAPPQAALVDEEALAHDMDVDDPGSEAKGQAPTFADQMGNDGLLPSAEDAFALAAEMPRPVHVPEASARGRRRATIDKKRVSPFTGSEQHNI